MTPSGPHSHRAEGPVRRVGAGQTWPLGLSDRGPAVGAQGEPVRHLQAAVWAPDADAVEWCLFDADGQVERQRVVLSDRTDGVWHAMLQVPAGDLEHTGLVWGWRVHGPWHPDEGHRFNPAKVLLDPWAHEVVGCYTGDLDRFQGPACDGPGPCHQDNADLALKARWRPNHDQSGTVRSDGTRRPWCETVLYEAHVRGLTMRHPAIPTDQRGTYAALAHPAMLAHYRQLGITTLSLLPVHARADEARLQRLGLSNYWGYNSIGFLAAEPRYAASADPAQDPGDEFRQAVADLHAAGFEVVLDVVFNHTAESDEAGPSLSMRGLANARYYRLRRNDPARYENWTGCGNCLDLTQPRVLELVMASLRHWVLSYGVDGFRFDLAPVLSRGLTGQFERHAAFVAALQADPVLARVKWIAEPWDLGPDGYQLGAFATGWREWNDRFRDEVRDWWLSRPAGQAGSTRAALAHRWAASSAQFHHDGRSPSATVNFITAHDGFTLRDLVSYGHKHNQANGEHNRDGHDHNRSWNAGIEGPSDDPVVRGRRLSLSRSLLASLLLAQGTPMLLAGDELGHSQRGNNNAYCQDNEVTWLDWQGPDAEDLTATVARLLRLRRAVPALRLDRWWTGQGDVRWLGPDGLELLGQADWHASTGTLTIEWPAPEAAGGCWVLCNAESAPVTFRLPPGAHRARPVFDSAQARGVPAGSPAPGDVTPVAAHGLQVWMDPVPAEIGGSSRT